MRDLEQVGGARFEQWIKPLWDRIAGEPVEARGLNKEGTPVPGEFDACWPGNGAEASSDQRYFERPYKKAKDDVAHVRQVAPQLGKIWLFCTRVAPPGTLGKLRRAVKECHGEEFELEVWDGRKIAEYIVDELLKDRSYVERVGSALPMLQSISERNAATGIVPPQSPVYGGRESEEAELRRRLETSKCVVLWGLSGIGKTQVAVAAAQALQERFDLVMWVTATDIKSALDLRSVDVRNNGYKHNVWGMLKEERALVVLDDVTVDLDLDEMAAECGESRVIVTLQTAFGEARLGVGFVGREHVRRILSSGAGRILSRCHRRSRDRTVRGASAPNGVAEPAGGGRRSLGNRGAGIRSPAGRYNREPRHGGGETACEAHAGGRSRVGVLFLVRQHERRCGIVQGPVRFCRGAQARRSGDDGARTGRRSQSTPVGVLRSAKAPRRGYATGR